MAYETEQAIYDRLRQAPTFHPAGVSLFAPDWTLEPGDVVTVRSGEDSYRMPVYSLDLQWQGQSKVGIQSTGNQKREPLPALQRRRYAAGRASYQQEQDIEELQEQTVQYTQQFEVSDQKIASIMTATGVLLDENYEPVIDPVTGLFVFDTTNQGATLMSRIDQNAAGVSSVVSQTGAVTAVFDKDHPGGYAVGDRVLYNGVAYRFTQAHAQGTDWTGTDVTAIPAMQTQITTVGQTANSVYSEVVAARDGQSTLKSRIDQQADRISLVVTGTGQNAQVNTAGIILAINGGTGSSAIISADKIDLQGYVTASELFATDAEIGQYLKATNIITTGTIKTAILDVLNGADIEGGLTVSDGSTLTGGVVVDSITIGYPAAQGRQLTKTAVDGLLTAVTLTPPASGQNTYTLSATKLDGTTAQIGTFSRATSLNGGWSGGEYTVTATPQNEENSTTLYAIAANGEPSKNSVLPKYLNVPLKVLYDDGEDGQETGFTETISVNASLIWQDGYDAGAGSVTPINPTLHIGSTWDYDENSDWYQKVVQVRNGTSVLETDYVDLPTISGTKITLTKGTISTTNTYTGSYSIQRSSGGVVTVSDVAGAGFTIGVNALSLALELGTPVCSLGAAGTTNWNSTSHQYEYTVSSSLGVDGTGNVLTRQTGTLTLTPTDAINYGKTQAEVVTSFATAVVPAGASPTPLTSGEKYKLLVTREGSTVLEQYYSVPAQATISLQDKTVTENGTVTCDSGYDGLGTVTVNVPKTSVDVQTLRTVSYSANGTYTVSPSTGYDAMASVRVTVDVPSGTQRTATGLSDTITLTSSDIGSAVNKTAIVEYDDDSETVNFPVRIDASAVYSAGQSSVTGRTVTSITPTITLSDTNTGTSTHNVTVTYSDGGTSPSTVSVNAARVYSAGQSSVSIDTATITQITASASMRAASASVYIRLSNGDEKTLTNVDVSPFYQAGLDGQAQPSGRANVRLVDENDAFIRTATKTIDVSGVYQKGVDDRSGGSFPKTMYVYTNNGGTLNVRQGASTSSSILGSLYPRTQVNATGEDGNYYKISFDGISGTAPSGYSYGYVEKSYMSDSSDSPTEYGTKRGWFAYIYVYASNGGTVRVRASASSSGTIIGTLYPKTAIADIGEDGDYYEIRLSGISGTPDRTGYSTGYILKSLTSTSANSPSNYGNKRGWYAAVKNGDPTGNSTYPYYGVTTGTATNIYNAPNGATIVFTAGRNSNIMCTVNPANQSSGWTPCKLNAYEGYVQLSSFH